MVRGFFICVAALCLSARAFAEPALEVSPTDMLAGTMQEIRLEFTIGDEEISPGGGVRIELPVAYLETEPYYWDCPQTDLPGARGYVEAIVPGGSAHIEISGRYDGIIECDIEGTTLREGDVLTLIYRGVVQSITWDMHIPVQWRQTADDEWVDLSFRPTLSFRPHSAVTLFAAAPGDVVQGEPFELAVVLLDRFGNRATGYRGEVSFASSDPDAVLPEAYTFTEDDAGVHVFDDVEYRTLGFQKITLTDGVMEGHWHHTEVHATEPAHRRLFGDTHFHTGTGTNHQAFTVVSAGGDHRGHFSSQIDAYEYVRDVMRLDFASASEHDTPLLTEDVWETSRQNADNFNDEGHFTTFYAYEWTASPNEGHHIILYLDRDSEVLNHIDHPTKVDMYEALEEQHHPAVMIPHVTWQQPEHEIWGDVSNEYRRVGEIYSLWNNRFLLQPADEPQRFELGPDDPWSYQYGWSHGHEIGVIGSTDNHTGQPGANNWSPYTQHTGGLAAVWATENSRPGIWESIHERRTYATTGVRILLEFTADGHWMGERYSTDEAPVFTVRAAGTNTIENVEIVKYNGETFETIHSVQPDAETCEIEFTDEDFDSDSMYYARVSQVDERYRSPWSHTTREMAWSSPIWIDQETD